jgi:hypothetical protein
MKQINFNNYRDQMSDDDIDQIHELIAKGCQKTTRGRLLSILKYHKSSIEHAGILERLIKEDGKWRYIAGQSYTCEIKIVRDVMLGKI